MAGRERKSKDSKFKLEHILIVGVIIVLGLMAKKFQSKKMAARFIPVEVAPSPDFQEVPIESGSDDPGDYENKLVEQRIRYAARNLLRLKTLGLKEVNGRLRIPFRFIPQKVWCQGGDLDTMKYASKDLGAKKVLITLESSDGRGGDSLRTSVSDLYKGIQHVFDLKPGQTKSYGLYICSDAGNGTSCKDKALKSHASMASEFARTRGSSANDNIFYYQHLVLDQKSLEVYESNDRSDTFKKSIGTYLTKQKDIEFSEFEAAWKVSNVMKSTAADIRDGRLQLSLPYNDPLCLGVRK